MNFASKKRQKCICFVIDLFFGFKRVFQTNVCYVPMRWWCVGLRWGNSRKKKLPRWLLLALYSPKSQVFVPVSCCSKASEKKVAMTYSPVTNFSPLNKVYFCRSLVGLANPWDFFFFFLFGFKRIKVNFAPWYGNPQTIHAPTIINNKYLGIIWKVQKNPLKSY